MKREDEKTGGKRGEEKRRKGKEPKKRKVNRRERNNFLDNFVNKTATW
jgi:hypothetical protein